MDSGVLLSEFSLMTMPGFNTMDGNLVSFSKLLPIYSWCLALIIAEVYSICD